MKDGRRSLASQRWSTSVAFGERSRPGPTARPPKAGRCYQALDVRVRVGRVGRLRTVSPNDSTDWPDRIRGAIVGLLGMILSGALLGLAMYIDSVA